MNTDKKSKKKLIFDKKESLRLDRAVIMSERKDPARAKLGKQYKNLLENSIFGDKP